MFEYEPLDDVQMNTLIDVLFTIAKKRTVSHLVVDTTVSVRSLFAPARANEYADVPDTLTLNWRLSDGFRYGPIPKSPVGGTEWTKTTQGRDAWKAALTMFHIIQALRTSPKLLKRVLRCVDGIIEDQSGNVVPLDDVDDIDELCTCTGRDHELHEQCVLYHVAFFFATRMVKVYNDDRPIVFRLPKVHHYTTPKPSPMKPTATTPVYDGAASSSDASSDMSETEVYTPPVKRRKMKVIKTARVSSPQKKRSAPRGVTKRRDRRRRSVQQEVIKKSTASRRFEQTLRSFPANVATFLRALHDDANVTKEFSLPRKTSSAHVTCKVLRDGMLELNGDRIQATEMFATLPERLGDEWNNIDTWIGTIGFVHDLDESSAESASVIASYSAANDAEDLSSSASPHAVKKIPDAHKDRVNEEARLEDEADAGTLVQLPKWVDLDTALELWTTNSVNGGLAGPSEGCYSDSTELKKELADYKKKKLDFARKLGKTAQKTYREVQLESLIVKRFTAPHKLASYQKKAPHYPEFWGAALSKHLIELAKEDQIDEYLLDMEQHVKEVQLLKNSHYLPDEVSDVLEEQVPPVDSSDEEPLVPAPPAASDATQHKVAALRTTMEQLSERFDNLDSFVRGQMDMHTNLLKDMYQAVQAGMAPAADHVATVGKKRARDHEGLPEWSNMASFSRMDNDPLLAHA